MVTDWNLELLSNLLYGYKLKLGVIIQPAVWLQIETLSHYLTCCMVTDWNLELLSNLLYGYWLKLGVIIQPAVWLQI